MTYRTKLRWPSSSPSLNIHVHRGHAKSNVLVLVSLPFSKGNEAWRPAGPSDQAWRAAGLSDQAWRPAGPSDQTQLELKSGVLDFCLKSAESAEVRTGGEKNSLKQSIRSCHGDITSDKLHRHGNTQVTASYTEISMYVYIYRIYVEPSHSSGQLFNMKNVPARPPGSGVSPCEDHPDDQRAWHLQPGHMIHLKPPSEQQKKQQQLTLWKLNTVQRTKHESVCLLDPWVLKSCKSEFRVHHPHLVPVRKKL